ncbi:MAG: hypothetical protein NTX44_00610 [Ignavibacteriales bacterium]|nr:hypothetical protein [Ignavibacteriales bacterium]
MITRMILSKTFVHSLLAFFCFVATALGQVLSIQEIDRQGERIQIDFAKIAYPIVDINSTLSITINTDAVRKTAARNKTIKPPVDPKQLDAIAQILREESKILGVIGPCTGTYEQCRNDLRMFSKGMLKLLMFIQSQKTLAAQVDSVLGLRNIPSGSEYKMVFALVRNEVSKAGMEIKNSADNDHVYFRLGGWIRDQSGNLRPIHIPQFDTYADGSFYEVPRFVTPTPEELRKQYSDAADAANEYNKNGSTALDGLTTRLNTLRDTIQTSLLSLNGALKNTVDLAPDIEIAKQDVKPFLDKLSKLVKEADDLEKLVTAIIHSSNALQASIASIEPILSLLQKMREDAKELVDLFDPTLKKLQKLVQAVKKSELDSLIAISSKYIASFSAIAGDNTMITTVQQWIQMDVPKQTEVNLEFGEQVKQLLIEDIPESTEVDLRYTGQRSAGDEVYFKASLEDGAESKTGSSKSTELERITLTMFQVEAHAKLSAGVVFLSPFDKSQVSLTKQFQAAPSYNVMVKWGSRSSYAYNTFWSVGFGVNIAAPDFNLDSTPEIGLGVVASTAIDYFQIGVGRNFGVETWYWFFGLQLPVGTIVNPSVSLPESK